MQAPPSGLRLTVSWGGGWLASKTEGSPPPPPPREIAASVPVAPAVCRISLKTICFQSHSSPILPGMCSMYSVQTVC